MVSMILLLMTSMMVAETLASTGGHAGDHWTYDHQDKWPPLCLTGKKQSPINLPNNCKPQPSDPPVTVDSSLTLGPKNYNVTLPKEKMSFTNNGHTVSLVVAGYDKVVTGAPTISGSVANGQTYQWTELHFHWPYKSTEGSEHELSGKRETIEMHLVHFNTKFGSKAKAVDQEKGLLVLGVFFKVKPDNNSAMDPVVTQLDLIDKTEAKTGIRTGFALKQLTPQTFDGEFMTYEGSLTTPPCYETVTWVVDSQIRFIGKQQLAEFQKIDDHVSRYRKIQPLNGRTIKASGKKFCGRQ